MATLDDLFGPTAPKAGKAVKLPNVGDTFTGVISGDAKVMDETDFATRKPKYIVKSASGKWEPKVEGEFDPELEHFKVTQIVVPVTDADGNERTLYVAGKLMKAALKAVMQETGIPLSEGTTIAVQHHAMDGRAKDYRFKLVAAE